MRACLQPEIATLIMPDGTELWTSSAPDGLFFRPVSFNIESDTILSQEQWFQFLEQRLCTFDELTSPRTEQD